MFVADFVKTLSPDFIVFNDFVKLCGCPKVATVLSKFLWWAQVSERKYPERNGWFFQTHKDFLDQFSLKRRGYEKARKVLVEQLGVLEYRRAGFFGRMNWRINADKLRAQLCKLSGQAVTPIESNFHKDRDGFWLPKSIPLEQWHLFLDSRTIKTGKIKQSNQSKKKWVSQLEKLIKEYNDVPAYMSFVASRGWANFIVHSSVKWDEVIRSHKALSTLSIIQSTQKQTEPPDKPDKSPEDVDSIRLSIRKKLKIKGND